MQTKDIQNMLMEARKELLVALLVIFLAIILYIWTLNLIFLRCVHVEENEKIMNEIHVEICGSHMNGYFLDIKDSTYSSRVLMAYDGIGLLSFCEPTSSESR